LFVGCFLTLSFTYSWFADFDEIWQVGLPWALVYSALEKWSETCSLPSNRRKTSKIGTMCQTQRLLGLSLKEAEFLIYNVNTIYILHQGHCLITCMLQIV